MSKLPSCESCPGCPWPGPVCADGPDRAAMLFLGMAPAAEEIRLGRPFVGSSGKILSAQLQAAGIVRGRVVIDNVVRCRPPADKLEPHCPAAYERCRPQTDAVFARVKPNITVLLGDVPLQAITGKHGVQQWRGSIIMTEQYGKCIATIHPAALLRSWKMYSIVVGDLRKAARENITPAYVPWEERFVLWPTPEIIESTIDYVVRHDLAFTLDIEAEQGAITYIAIAYSDHDVLSIPLIKLEEDGSVVPFWPRAGFEQVWSALDRLLRSTCVKGFQNGVMFDLTWLERFGLQVVPPIYDTMLMHHTLFAELPHSLAFIASTQTSLDAWKWMARTPDSEESSK